MHKLWCGFSFLLLGILENSSEALSTGLLFALSSLKSPNLWVHAFQTCFWCYMHMSVRLDCASMKCFICKNNTFLLIEFCLVVMLQRFYMVKPCPKELKCDVEVGFWSDLWIELLIFTYCIMLQYEFGLIFVCWNSFLLMRRQILDTDHCAIIILKIIFLIIISMRMHMQDIKHDIFWNYILCWFYPLETWTWKGVVANREEAGWVDRLWWPRGHLFKIPCLPSII